ncbi:MAG: uridine kinase [Planctomycetota bacterium]
MATQFFNPIVVGIAGGSGSGKTYVAQRIQQRLGPASCLLLDSDAYYRDLSHLTPDQRAVFDFDVPGAIEWGLYHRHVHALRAGQSIDKPRYDFSTHTRRPGSEWVHSRPVILLEGILVLAEEQVRECMDYRVFVDTPADLRLARRIERDIRERGRTAESVLMQYSATVRPAHEAFVEPSRRFAHVTIPSEDPQSVANAVDFIVAGLSSRKQRYIPNQVRSVPQFAGVLRTPRMWTDRTWFGM